MVVIVVVHYYSNFSFPVLPCLYKVAPTLSSLSTTNNSLMSRRILLGL